MKLSARFRDLYDVQSGSFWRHRNIFLRAGLATSLLVATSLVASFAGRDFTWPILVGASSLAILVTIQLLQARARKGHD